MKKIFILTGEPSGDKLASKVISRLQKNDPNIDYSCVGGTHLNSLGIKSIFDLKEITYIGFTSVLLNIFKIKNKINKTVEEIIKFNPDVLFSVDSPDFTLRVAEKVKRNNPKIKTIHYVAPQVWVWREERVKKIKKFIDHIFLLFNFEKPFFEKENMSHEFVGHPLLESNQESTIDLNQILEKNKALISIFAGRAGDTGKDPIPEFVKSIKLAKKFKNVEILWASVREPYNYLQAKQLGCQIITIPPILIEKIEKFGKSFNQLTVETVKAFLVDSKKSNFKL